MIYLILWRCNNARTIRKKGGRVGIWSLPIIYGLLLPPGHLITGYPAHMACACPVEVVEVKPSIQISLVGLLGSAFGVT